MIPYVEFYTWRVGPVPINPFGPCVGLSVYVGWELAKRRARFYGWDHKKLVSFTRWIVCWGFILGHVFDEVTYYPHEVVEKPWMLLFFWEHMSSYGGFIGGVAAGFYWKWFEFVPWKKLGPVTLHKVGWKAVPEGPGLMVSDLMCSSLPIAWCIGRLGCALVHDHPGKVTTRDAIFAVATGPGPVDDYGLIGLHHGVIPRYDLGLLELLLCIPMAIGFVLLWKKRLMPGTFTVLACLIYPVLRFPLDFLRVPETDGGDARYLSLTPAQWVCIACFALGIWLWFFARREAAKPSAQPIAPPP